MKCWIGKGLYYAYSYLPSRILASLGSDARQLNTILRLGAGLGGQNQIGTASQVAWQPMTNGTPMAAWAGPERFNTHGSPSKLGKARAN